MVSTVKSCAHSSIATGCGEVDCAKAAARAPSVSASAQAVPSMIRRTMMCSLRASAQMVLHAACQHGHHVEAYRARLSSMFIGHVIQTYGNAVLLAWPWPAGTG